MNFQDCFPVWNKLNANQQNRILGNLITRNVKKGTILHNGSADCTGLLLVKSGQLRAYILSDEGREITIYRLFDMDICLFSASCIMRSIQFEVTIEAEKDTELWVIPAEIYQSIMEESVAVANYTQPNFELGYALKFMRLLLLMLTALFNWAGFAAGCVIVICSICFNRTLSGRSYLNIKLN